MKRCTQCLELKSLGEYGSNGNGGIRANCKACERKRKKEHYKRNREDILNKKKEYQKSNQVVLSERRKKRYINNRNKILNSNKKWVMKNKSKKLKADKKWREQNKDSINSYSTKWRAENREIYNAIQARRRSAKRMLPNNLSADLSAKLYSEFNYMCFLSKETQNTTLEHFVALSTGHCGSLYENCYLLNSKLNSSKKDKNPFEWIKHYNEYQEEFVELANKLAFKNALTYEEYKNFVYWCYSNKRRNKEIAKDQRHSIEIWRDETKRHFPLPRYATT